MSTSPKLTSLVVAMVVASALFPWLGIGARLLTPDPWSIAVIGLILWLANCTTLWYLHRFPEVKAKRSLGTAILLWTFVFIPLFYVTAAATDMVIRR